MATVINVTVDDQKLALSSTPLIASGGKNENKVQFEFDSSWDGFEKTAVFWQKPGTAYYSIVGSDDSCVVPHEATMGECDMFFGVFGLSGDVKKTSEVIAYRIVKGVLTENIEPSDPTPEIYEQILSAMADKANVDDVPTLLSELEEDEEHRTVSDDEKAEWSAKQDAIPTNTYDTYGAATAVQTNLDEVTALIPNQATTSNQLADKNFVNSSIATNTANFRGTFDSLEELEAYSGTKTPNDYAFVQSAEGVNISYERYKWNGSSWVYEYTLNNSSFTAAQLAALNSGITSNLVDLIGASEGIYVGGYDTTPPPGAKIWIDPEETVDPSFLTVSGLASALTALDNRASITANDINGFTIRIGKILIQTGDVTVTPSSANSNKTVVVTFPIPYKSGTVPFVNGGLKSSVPDKVDFTASYGVTNEHFSVVLRRSDGTTATGVKWLAVGMED